MTQRTGKSSPNYGQLKNYDNELKELINKGFGPYEIAKKIDFDAGQKNWDYLFITRK